MNVLRKAGEDSHRQPLAHDDAELANLKGVALLRALKQLEEEDLALREKNVLDEEMELRQQHVHHICASDHITIVEDGKKMLEYDSYLEHQRYYDDWKHADIPLINFGNLGNYCNPSASYGKEKNGCGVCDAHLEQQHLVIEQQKSLGKGGIVWDAGFVLAEHLILRQNEWLHIRNFSSRQRPSILELGAGTGLAGLALAKFLPCDALVTDLPELLGLMERNVCRNFQKHEHESLIHEGGRDSITPTPINEEEKKTDDNDCLLGRISPCCVSFGGSCSAPVGNAIAKTLRWGFKEDYPLEAPDVIIGSDIIVSIYDTSGLIQTIYDLSGAETKIYLSYKGRLDSMMNELASQLEGRFTTLKSVQPFSRNRNPTIRIIEISGKIIES
jgi:hypothetical protein